MSARRMRSKAEQVLVRERIVALKRGDPSLPLTTICKRLGCSPDTVLASLRAAGLHVPDPTHGGGRKKVAS